MHGRDTKTTDPWSASPANVLPQQSDRGEWLGAREPHVGTKSRVTQREPPTWKRHPTVGKYPRPTDVETRHPSPRRHWHHRTSQKPRWAHEEGSLGLGGRTDVGPTRLPRGPS